MSPAILPEAVARRRPAPAIRGIPPAPRQLRAIGFDDAPFDRRATRVWLAGAVCSGTRFEGLVTGAVRRDGWNAGAVIRGLLQGGKFLPQLHLVLLDGLTFGGFNVVHLPELAAALRVPCVAVLRRPPDLAAVERAARRLPGADRRMARIQAAGPVHHRPPFAFQVQGAGPDEVHDALLRLTDRGNVPEALRLAHLIGAAIATGESGRRA